MGLSALDNNGNTLTDERGKSYTWDFENQLIQAVVTSTGTVTFKYDPFGRRIQKSGPNGTTNYLYDDDNLIEEVDLAKVMNREKVIKVLTKPDPLRRRPISGR